MDYSKQRALTHIAVNGVQVVTSSGAKTRNRGVIIMVNNHSSSEDGIGLYLFADQGKKERRLIEIKRGAKDFDFNNPEFLTVNACDGAEMMRVKIFDKYSITYLINEAFKRKGENKQVICCFTFDAGKLNVGEYL